MPQSEDPPISKDEKQVFRRAVDELVEHPIANLALSDDGLQTGPDVIATIDNADFLLDKLPAEKWVQSHQDIQYFTNGIQHKRRKMLKNGDIPIQACCDLHGMTIREAQRCTIDFLNDCIQKKYNCIRLIHGQGSPDKPPKIKNLLNIWLPELESVLAFQQCCRRDGGLGAITVLLRTRK